MGHGPSLPLRETMVGNGSDLPVPRRGHEGLESAQPLPFTMASAKVGSPPPNRSVQKSTLVTAFASPVCSMARCCKG